MLLLIVSAIVCTTVGLIATWHRGPVFAIAAASIIGAVGALAAGIWMAWRARRQDPFADRTKP